MISHAAFTNPFSDQRYELDLKIAGHFDGGPQRVELLKKVVCERVQILEAQGKAEIRHYSGAEREVMRNGFLFEVFHRFCHEFDQLIIDQNKAGDASCRVHFAPEALALLVKEALSWMKRFASSASFTSCAGLITSSCRD